MRIILKFLVSVFIVSCFFSPIVYASEGGVDLGMKSYKCTSMCFESSSISHKDRQLWNKVIHPYLQDPLWKPRDIYDACHHLMIPLHAAFLLVEPQWQQDFDSHFRRFLADYPGGMKSGVKQRLDRLYYFYLISRYLALSPETSNTIDLKHRLYGTVLREVEKVWGEDPAWQWGRLPFAGGVRERVLWKLNDSDVSISYYRAIIDEEFFLFAIAADLLASSSFSGNEPSQVLLDIVSVARQVFENEVIWNEHGGWLFQPGVWADGPGQAYAGQFEKIKGMKVSPLPDVAWDSSHSHRFPLWLTSLENASRLDSEGSAFYRHLKKGLTNQLVKKVLIPPGEQFPLWRLTNYMDGRNGIYRWRDKDGFGYGPYELSGTFLIGWWSLLNSEKISKVYSEIAAQFPLKDSVVKLLVGPNASRARHHLIVLPNKYENGLIELIVDLSSKLYFSEYFKANRVIEL